MYAEHNPLTPFSKGEFLKAPLIKGDLGGCHTHHVNCYGLAGVFCVFKTFCNRIATRWCNGNTRDFGSLIGGSSPPRVAIVFYRQQRQVSNLSLLYLI